MYTSDDGGAGERNNQRPLLSLVLCTEMVKLDRYSTLQVAFLRIRDVRTCLD